MAKKTTKSKTQSKRSKSVSSRKKSTKKKTTTRKKSTSRKKAATRKSTTRKKAETKSTSKKSSTGKKTTATKTGAKQKSGGSKGKSVSKPKTVSKKKSDAQSASKTSKKSKKAASAPESTDSAKRYRVSSTDSIASSRAAAAKLAASAGLASLNRSSDASLLEEQDYKRLTKSPLSKKQLREFREILLLKRAELVGDVNDMETQALTGSGSGSLSHLPQHMADAGSDTYDQSLALDLVASQRALLKEIDDAIARIDANTYGVCEKLGKPINLDRLKSTPWARYCIEYARQLETNRYAS